MSSRRFSREVAAHAFSWLLLGNAAGLLMAALLLAPGLGGLLGALSYGRWAALHIDSQIYGFCSLPLLGLLLRFYSPAGEAGRLSFLAIRTWSAALAFLAVSILSGHSSGKIFAEWTGAARWVFAGALALATAAVLAAFFARRRLAAPSRPASRLAEAARAIGLLLLVPAPLAMIWAPSPRAYPPIDTAGGGATGGNTLASVLGVGLVLALSPYLCGLLPRDGGRFARRVFAGLGAHFLLLALLSVAGPGDRSNAEPVQIAAMASALIWLPILWRHLRLFPWPAASRLWSLAMAGWSLVLAATGLVAGLPGMAVKIKYTNFLVGHVHAAAAGFLTAWLFVLFEMAARQGGETSSPAADRKAFFGWQLGCLLQVLALLMVGGAEGAAPEVLWSGAPVVAAGYALRLLGGALMTFSSWRWLRAALLMAGSPAEEFADVPSEFPFPLAPARPADGRLLPLGGPV